MRFAGRRYVRKTVSGVGGGMRHGCSDPIFAETDGCRDIRRRNRLRKRGVSACALSRIYTPPYGGRFPENGFADAVSRRTACDRQFPLQYFVPDIFQGARKPGLDSGVRRDDPERGRRASGSKEYGILSVLLQAWYDIEYLFTVNETVFNPPPKVKSAVVRLRRNGVDRLDCDERLFVRVVKASFGQRRKMLRNSLRAAFGDFGGAEHPFFTQRAEQLSVADFVELTRWVDANGIYF